MKTFYPLLPGIRAIGWVPASEIPASADALAAAGVAVPVLAEVHPLRFTGEPTLEASAEPDGSGHKFTTTLTFASADTVPLHMHVAFVVVGVDGTPLYRRIRHRTILPGEGDFHHRHDGRRLGRNHLRGDSHRKSPATGGMHRML